jgi:hypothetical protein
MPRYQFPALINTIAPVELVRVIQARPVDEYHCALELRFPAIMQNIQTMWGYREIDAYFAKLTIDERGDREGFPSEVWDDLQMLMRLHAAVYPRL